MLAEGSSDVWLRPEEVSDVTPSCKKVTPGWGSLLDHRPRICWQIHKNKSAQSKTRYLTELLTQAERWRQALKLSAKNSVANNRHALINPYMPAQTLQLSIKTGQLHLNKAQRVAFSSIICCPSWASPREVHHFQILSTIKTEITKFTLLQMLLSCKKLLDNEKINAFLCKYAVWTLRAEWPLQFVEVEKL